jgi:hypothetical protein
MHLLFQWAIRFDIRKIRGHLLQSSRALVLGANWYLAGIAIVTVIQLVVWLGFRKGYNAFLLEISANCLSSIREV